MRIDIYDSSLSILTQTFGQMPANQQLDLRHNIYFAKVIDPQLVTLKKLLEFLIAAKGKVNLVLEKLNEKIEQIVKRDGET